MSVISFDIDDRKVEALLERMGGFELLQPAKIAGEELIKISQNAFEAKKDPVTGSPWAKSQSNSDTLYRSGDLFRSLAYDAGSRGSLLEIGSHKEYAHIHQEGGKAGRGRKVSIPQRRYLGAPASFAKNLLEMQRVKKLLGV